MVHPNKSHYHLKNRFIITLLMYFFTLKQSRTANFPSKKTRSFLYTLIHNHPVWLWNWI
ncbi:hypothetical protein Hdeb2414_s0551g00915561 [Helianthus debilis subsp. tardiflorus]